MPTQRSTRAPRLARRLVLLPVLAAALGLGVAPATVPAKAGKSAKGGSSADAHKPYGKGDGRKFK